MRPFLNRSAAVLAAFSFQIAASQVPVTAATPQCMSQEEAVAEKIRRLKTTLMVGALQCDRASHLKVAESYNAFIETHGASIQKHDRTLLGYFQRTHGKTHRKAMDRHVTSTANKVATQSYKTQGFCEKVSTLAGLSLAGSSATLLAVAEKNTIAPSSLASCAAPVIKAAQSMPQPITQ